MSRGKWIAAFLAGALAASTGAAETKSKKASPKPASPKPAEVAAPIPTDTPTAPSTPASIATVVVYNEADPDSRALARYYAARRGVLVYGLSVGRGRSKEPPPGSLPRPPPRLGYTRRGNASFRAPYTNVWGPVQAPPPTSL